MRVLSRNLATAIFVLGVVFGSAPIVEATDPCGAGLPEPNLMSTTVHAGDLVLSGSDSLVIDNEKFIVEGNVYLSGDARLLLRNAELVVQHYPRQEIAASDRAIFDAENAVVTGFIHSHFGDESTLNMNRVFMINLIDVTGFAHVTVRDSCLFEERFGVVGVSDHAQVEITDSEVGAIGIHVPVMIPAVIDGLMPGYFEHWSATSDISPQLDYELVLNRTTVHENPGYSGGFEIGWNISTGADADLTVRNSILNKLVIEFTSEDVDISGLIRGSPVNLDIGSIHLVDTEIQGQWGIFVSDGEARIEDSDGVWLWPRGTRDTIITNTAINEFDPRQYSGTVRLASSSMTNGFEVFAASVFRMEGSVNMLEISPLFTSDSFMTRQYPVEVVDTTSGAPIAGLELTLTRSGPAEWTATTGNDGRAVFELTFGRSNYEDIWTLATPDPATRLSRDISIYSDTPVLINLVPAPAGDGWIPLAEVDCRLTNTGNGTADSPYNSIQDGVDNVGLDGYVRVAPGTCNGDVRLRDGVLVEGAGGGLTVIAGNVFAQEVDQAWLRNATIADDDTAGIHCYDASLTVTNVIVWNQPHNGIHGSNCVLTARNNTLIGNGHNGILLIEESTATIENNIIALNGLFGVAGGGSTAVLDYNDFWGNAEGAYGEGIGGGFSDITLDPRFVSMSDFRLLHDSPCIGEGNPDPAFDNPDGTRNTIGAFGGPFTFVHAVPDADGDGVWNDDDICPGTVLPDVAPRLKKSRYSVTDAGQFVSEAKNAPTYSIMETAGCSAIQIVDEMGLGRGHRRFGLSRSALETWIAQLAG